MASHLTDDEERDAARLGRVTLPAAVHLRALNRREYTHALRDRQSDHTLPGDCNQLVADAQLAGALGGSVWREAHDVRPAERHVAPEVDTCRAREAGGASKRERETEFRMHGAGMPAGGWATRHRRRGRPPCHAERVPVTRPRVAPTIRGSDVDSPPPDMVGAPPARALRGCHDGRGVLMLSSSGSAARMGAGNIGRTESRGICRHNSGTERLARLFSDPKQPNSR